MTLDQKCGNFIELSCQQSWAADLKGGPQDIDYKCGVTHTNAARLQTHHGTELRCRRQHQPNRATPPYPRVYHFVASTRVRATRPRRRRLDPPELPGRSPNALAPRAPPSRSSCRVGLDNSPISRCFAAL
jgi:hypothetical protein